MHSLRWKTGYRSGNAQKDQENKAVVDCLNILLEAVRQRGHCSGVEEMLDELVNRTDELLRAGHPAEVVKAVLRDNLLATVPLPNYGSQSCRACGICDLARHQVEQHLQAPALCMDLPQVD